MLPETTALPLSTVVDTPVAVRLTVYGAPAPKGSRTAGKRRDGSVFTRPASNGEHAWVEAVAKAATWRAAQPGRLASAPYRVALRFLCARPQRPSHGHPSRHDLDKLARAVLDGLVRGRLLVDDRHVVELIATKDWATTPDGACVHVVIEGVA